MKHFTEVDLLEMSYLPPGEATSSMLHLAGCEECRARYQRLQQKLRGNADQACRRIEEKPDTFWARQRLSILRSIQEHPSRAPVRHSPRVAAVAAALALLVGGVAAFRHSTGHQQPAPARRSVVHTAVEQTPRQRGSDQVFQEIQDSHDPWNSDELRSYHGVVEWESWDTTQTSPSGGAL